MVCQSHGCSAVVVLGVYVDSLDHQKPGYVDVIFLNCNMHGSAQVFPSGIDVGAILAENLHHNPVALENSNMQGGFPLPGENVNVGALSQEHLRQFDMIPGSGYVQGCPSRFVFFIRISATFHQGPGNFKITLPAGNLKSSFLFFVGLICKLGVLFQNRPDACHIISFYCFKKAFFCGFWTKKPKHLNPAFQPSNQGIFLPFRFYNIYHFFSTV